MGYCVYMTKAGYALQAKLFAEGGDVRMISLNYVNTDDQSLYQVGKDDSGGDGQEPEGIPENAVRRSAVYFLKTEKKGGVNNAESENI